MFPLIHPHYNVPPAGLRCLFHHHNCVILFIRIELRKKVRYFLYPHQYQKWEVKANTGAVSFKKNSKKNILFPKNEFQKSSGIQPRDSLSAWFL